MQSCASEFKMASGKWRRRKKRRIDHVLRFASPMRIMIPDNYVAFRDWKKTQAENEEERTNDDYALNIIVRANILFLLLAMMMGYAMRLPR